MQLIPKTGVKRTQNPCQAPKRYNPFSFNNIQVA